MNIYLWDTFLIAEYRVYNKRSKLIEESIHIKVVETTHLLLLLMGMVKTPNDDHEEQAAIEDQEQEMGMESQQEIKETTPTNGSFPCE